MSYKVIPDQSGNSGKYLKTDGTELVWDSPAGGSYVLQTTTLTINGVTYDLSANRSWTVTASLPDLITGKYAPSTDQVILEGCFAYYSGYYEIQDTKVLEIELNSVLEIG